MRTIRIEKAACNIIDNKTMGTGNKKTKEQQAMYGIKLASIVKQQKPGTNRYIK